MPFDQRHQSVPVFVGSTFEDLQTYRAAVREALVRMQAIVHGMEYFGSLPEKPLDVCLNKLRQCKVYIGIFAMRYGFVPPGDNRSMTHIEYDEAQRLDLPSRIYIIDENRQPILPKYVETGEGAQKLKNLKETLCTKHTRSLFTTEHDLAGKILGDLPRVLEHIGLKGIGDKIKDVVPPDYNYDSEETLRKFRALPGRFNKTEVFIEFVIDKDFDSATEHLCQAWSLKFSETIAASFRLSEDVEWLIVAEDAVAEELIGIKRGMNVKVRALTSFGMNVRGLLVKEILQVTAQQVKLAAAQTDEEKASKLPTPVKNFRWNRNSGP